MKEKISSRKWFRVVVVLAVMLIPFMYSFFYLKAYWDPYGEGNIDNLPVAVVNSDKGDKGQILIDNIKESKKLKLSVVSSSVANSGLNDGTYYAIINIPEDFTSSMESIGSDLYHPTITYSPNMKSNYLSSQIINTVLFTVEKNLDNTINSEIIDGLTEKLEEVPSQLEVIKNGFSELSNGTYKIKGGSSELADGFLELENGMLAAYNGSKKITNMVNEKLDEVKNDMSNSIDDDDLMAIKNQTIDAVKSNFTDEYKNQIGVMSGEQAVLALSSDSEYALGKEKITLIDNMINSLVAGYSQTTGIGIDNYIFCKDFNDRGSVYTFVNTNASGYVMTLEQYCPLYVSLTDQLNKMDQLAYSVAYQTAISVSESSAISTAGSVSENVAKQVADSAKAKVLSETTASLNALNTGLTQLTDGLSRLVNGSSQIDSGLVNLKQGSATLNSRVNVSSDTIGTKLDTTRDEITKLESLTDYSKNPINVLTEEVNKVSSYGTAFAPLFISIALWIGCLMMFIVLYFDKDKRFGIFGLDSNKLVKRTFAYHGLATVTGFLLGILLQIFLDFEITNIWLYYGSIILIANCFLAIIEFLIENFGDIGKFIALVILVLQLASSGGTFPIETVTKGFRILNPVLPMTYTIKLLKESLISIDLELLRENLIIVLGMFIVFLGINLVINLYKERRMEKKI